jgi:DNA replication and repair protein RecF
MTRLWDSELCVCGEAIAELRERYVVQLAEFFHHLGGELLGLPVELLHGRGWRAGLTLEQALDESWPRDRLLKVTTVGPHRADISIRVDGVAAKERVSRGQQKLIAAALILGQQRHRIALGAAPACLLVDDPAAELDVDNLGKLMKAISKTSLQLIATGLSPSALGAFDVGRVFHVEQGTATQML